MRPSLIHQSINTHLLITYYVPCSVLGGVVQSCLILHDPFWGILEKGTGMVCHFFLRFAAHFVDEELRQTGLTDLPRVT